MEAKELSTRHFVMSGDLNHHGTLYAGRGVEWMVEAGLMAACDVTKSEHIVCLRINALLFRKPVPMGQLLRYAGKIIHAGRTSLVAYVKVTNSITEEFIVDGYFTYVYVDEKGKAIPHGITIEAVTEEDIRLMQTAKELAATARSN